MRTMWKVEDFYAVTVGMRRLNNILFFLIRLIIFLIVPTHPHRAPKTDPKSQALPCLEMQWKWEAQLLEFSCQRLRKLSVSSSYHIPFTLGKFRLSPLKIQLIGGNSNYVLFWKPKEQRKRRERYMNQSLMSIHWWVHYI